MIVPYARFRKRSIYKVIGCRILSFQEVFDVELVVRLKMQNLCIFQFNAVNILLKLRQISFNEGLSTALDVREARTQLIGAQIAQRAAAFKFVVAWVRLHAASGVMPEFMQTLTRADLVPVK